MKNFDHLCVTQEHEDFCKKMSQNLLERLSESYGGYDKIPDAIKDRIDYIVMEVFVSTMNYSLSNMK